MFIYVTNLVDVAVLKATFSKNYSKKNFFWNLPWNTREKELFLNNWEVEYDMIKRKITYNLSLPSFFFSWKKYIIFRVGNSFEHHWDRVGMETIKSKQSMTKRFLMENKYKNWSFRICLEGGLNGPAENLKF